ncbi:hypothetical protein [Burkholderia lata]|uniref:hypothetical protein n=1 Tax=Burkholderia lata (strain ATCC 17760 / DSM 23089 / LMG 22485 / NCIMB 9086 / R18194 / 383) TaxID=482957 RepID=UPI001583DBE3|nr:hypothetical protein [Burkholderia lata]
MRGQFGQVVLHVVSSSWAWLVGRPSRRTRTLGERGDADRGGACRAARGRMRRVLEKRLKRAAGVASTRRCAHPETTFWRMRVRRDVAADRRASLRRERLPVHRHGAARRVCQIVPQRIVPLRRQTVQTVGDDTCRSISIDCAHDAEHPRAGSRLK